MQEKLGLLCEHPGQQQPANRVQDDENLFGLLEDLHETILHYQVCSYLETLLDVNKDNRWRDGRRSTIKDPDG
jgi:hypothetical protein